ncbi:hypothetical protein DM860_010165 [Cuscuta australis]|uniref:VQ domain-containing protein n=1 Tax=Cuscuta australis TaxID=267555 RepID=A0A328DAN1_9ASTE|nr:hypothetical protein DM860_010165 [Cuscuta australis]
MSSSAAANANKPPSTAQRTFCVSSNPDPNSAHHNTTFVQADPSNFRAVVQRLTGAGQDPSAQKLPKVAARRTSPGEMGPRRPAFKLHERRQAARKLEISLGRCGIPVPLSPSAAHPSPVSPLDIAGTPRTPRSPMEVEEERGIAEKGYYLHPSPLGGARTGRSEPPELLTLFPLHSPMDHHHNSPPTS